MPRPLARVAAELQGSPAPVTQVCDVAVESQVQALITTARETFGRVDIVVNNAGLGTTPKPLIEVTEEDMDINYAVNAKGRLLWH